MPSRHRNNRSRKNAPNGYSSRGESRGRSASPRQSPSGHVLNEVGGIAQLVSAVNRYDELEEAYCADESNATIATPGTSFSTAMTANPFDTSFHRPLQSDLAVSFLPKQTNNAQCARTTEEVALELYGDNVNLDSSLCRKLAGEIALRVPHQRRPEQKLNMERRSNVEAVLAHMSGQVSLHPCKNCHKGHGPWKDCVVLEGLMCGSCANCWFNASGARCTFHENNNPLHHGFFGHPPYPTMPNMMPHQQPTVSLPPINQPTSGLLQSPPGPLSIPYFNSEITNWGLTETTGALITEAFNTSVHTSRNERYLARIEIAAKELGMRIAEYDEYLTTPEGVSEQQHSQGQVQHQADNHIPGGTFDKDEHTHTSPFSG